MDKQQKLLQSKTQLMGSIREKKNDIIELEKKLKSVNVDLYLIQEGKQGELLI